MRYLGALASAVLKYFPVIRGATKTVSTTIFIVVVFFAGLLLIPEEDITSIFPTLESMWSQR